MKMRDFCLFLLALISISSNLSAQKRQDSLLVDPPRYIAFQFSIDGKYDSAIYYYNKEINTLSDTSDKYWYYKYKIAGCFAKQGKSKKAKQIYLTCFKRIEPEKKNWFYLNLDDDNKYAVTYTFICLELADIFIAEKKYDSALYFINWNRLYWPERQTDGSTRKYEKEIKAAYQYAVCFKAKKQIDSAITHLSNYAFYTNAQVHRTFDSSQYYKLVKLYFEVLKKKYTPSEIRDSFFYAIDNIKHIDRTSSTILPGEDEKRKWHFVEIFLIFFGDKVVLLNGNYRSDPLDNSQAKRFSKEYILNDLKTAKIYELVSKSK